jgi:alpha-D-ribose 1-methylphosphonate 5-triphosphate synthase subunit PhnL
MNDNWIIKISLLSKTFRLYTQGDVCIPVLDSFSMTVMPSDGVALKGVSGAGKSTVLRLLTGNYRACSGEILVRHAGRVIDMAACSPHEIIDVRKWTIGYVSQFLRVIPRIPAIEVVAEPLVQRGVPENEALEKASLLLKRLNIPERLWSLSPVTFSGGQQQRVNLARAFIAEWPVMVLDEPTASLDAENRAVVLEMIREKRDSGSSFIGIFHDHFDRKSVADREIELLSPGETRGMRKAVTEENSVCA